MQCGIEAQDALHCLFMAVVAMKEIWRSAFLCRRLGKDMGKDTIDVLRGQPRGEAGGWMR